MLQLHMEPSEPIEIKELTGALDAISRQFQTFEAREESGAREARLLVSSVSRGSIDINLIPEYVAAGAAVVAPVVDQLGSVLKLADHLKKLLTVFSGGAKDAPEAGVTIKDCDDAINIAGPIAQHGGSQTFNVIKDSVVYQQVIKLDAPTSRRVVENATREKVRLQFPQSETRQRVSLVWTRLDRNKAKTGTSSPDKGIIADIEDKPKTILFTDELTYLKQEMIDDDENPMQKVYFVDVEVSRVNDKVMAYRVIGYHGKDDLP